MTTPQELAKQAQRLAQELQIFSTMLGGGVPEVQSNLGNQVSVNKLPPKPRPVAYQNNPNMPGYDPEIHIPVDRVPPRVEVGLTGQVMVRGGQIVVCTSCKTQVLQANRDIDGSDVPGRGLSLDAFDFLLSGLQWPAPVNVRTMPTGIVTDCPHCRGNTCLWLYGSPPQGGNL